MRNALTPRECIHDFNRMMLVLSELPVRFDNKLKMNLRTQLRGKYCVLPLRAKALLAGYVSASCGNSRPLSQNKTHDWRRQ